MRPFSRWPATLNEPIDGASLAVFRIWLGICTLGNAVRYEAFGIAQTAYVAPQHHLPYPPFDAILPEPGPIYHLFFALTALGGLGLAFGWRTRLSASLAALNLAIVELSDATMWLNHVYLQILLLGLCAVLPVSRCLSLDARRSPTTPFIPRWALWLVRLQLAVVYVWAGIEKLDPSWLIDADPLTIWLPARASGPWLGWLAAPWVAHTMAVAGCLFDLGIVPALLWRPTQKLAWCALIGFHIATGTLFNIGLFPWLMVGSMTVFLAPSWPRSFLGDSLRDRHPTAFAPPSNAARALLVLYAVFQIAWPARSALYEGDVRWTREGWRMSWRVLITESSGTLRYHTYDDAGKHWIDAGSSWLSRWQLYIASCSPDMVLWLGHKIGASHEGEAQGALRVTVDAWCSLDGRPSARLIDPTTNLFTTPSYPWGHWDAIEPSPIQRNPVE